MSVTWNDAKMQQIAKVDITKTKHTYKYTKIQCGELTAGVVLHVFRKNYTWNHVRGEWKKITRFASTALSVINTIRNFVAVCSISPWITLYSSYV